MLGVLARRGHELVLDPEAADVLVVNTCSFIQPAKEESIDAILELARVKAARAGRRLVVTGCLAQRYADELKTALPEVDVFVGTGDLLRIAEAVEAPAADGPVVYRGAQHVLPVPNPPHRVPPAPGGTASLKASKAAIQPCGSSIIPKIPARTETRPWR